MNRLLFAAVAACAFTASALADPLESLFNTDNLWTMKKADFMKVAEKLGYEWTSSAMDSARVARPRAASSSGAAYSASGGGLTAFGLPAVESVARFDGDKLSTVTVVLYARGDVGDWTEAQFDGLVRSAADAISAATKTKFTVRGKDPTNAVHAEGLVWAAPGARYLLEYSKTKALVTRNIAFRAEFVRLEATAPEKKLSLLASAANLQRAKFSGLTHVKRDASSGDVWLADVPMVDQGEKGYCVVAATERVMRYYGDKVDENELAQVANTGTAGGTSTNAMVDALKKLSARLKVRVREVEKFDIKEILTLIAEYNRAAQKNHKPPLPDQGHMIDVGAMYRDMDTDVLREVRNKNKGDLHRFQRAVQSHIDDGVPLLWTVMLGKVPEPGIPQNAGGHMRLIIGYNNTKDEILFSDSWGAGHELKRMKAEDAWTMTTGTMSIEPLN
ncbi:MAG: C39 family peptidase [Chthoniobacter sp.]|uniref:C39 family peptidase n=1 Tax=Chthoniobacter sp. TaxID=2510640 RepID=UPI0032A39261